MTDFKPSSDDVIARAKKLAKAAGTARFKDFLFEAGQELTCEHLIEKGEIQPPAPEDIAAAALVDAPIPAAVVEAEADTSAVVDGEAAPAETSEAEIVAEEPIADAEPAVAQPSEDDHAGEAAVEDDDIQAAAQPDPATALTDALAKAGDALESAAAAPAVEEPATPFADLEAAGVALKSISLPEGTPLAKGMYEVSRFADLLCSFACVQRGLAWEAESEGDSSPIPEALANAIADLGGLLVQLAQEEVAELVASLKRPEGVEVVEIIYAGDGIEAARQIVDLVKADTTLMEAAEERLAKAAPIAPPADLTEQVTTLTAENERLSKALGDAAPAVEEITERFTGTIDTLKSEIADLRKRFDDEPLPSKTAGTSRVVAKALDSSGAAAVEDAADSVLNKEQIAEAWKSLSEQEKGELLIRVSLANPGRIALPLSAAA